MTKELVIEVTTGIIVLGSVFGGRHLRKLSQTIEDFLVSRNLIRESPEDAIPGTQKNETAPPSPRFDG